MKLNNKNASFSFSPSSHTKHTHNSAIIRSTCSTEAKFSLLAVFLSQILFISGVVMTIGVKSSLQFFMKRSNFKGTISFGIGFFFVIIGWPVIGMALEAYGSRTSSSAEAGSPRTSDPVLSISSSNITGLQTATF
ncbi:Vesicle transport protein, Got1/SFT2-like protein [Cynara cardunculus var. scolymus]|uniref:Vesicle transport protein, Got1/SFT2-like protein n=1 Tax=Cynara cardunculus var. scolymus TaxID=59895 RepID=A0A118JUP5_CYNCS|nr:Vesicle transport protein, Got1/SFT2-like protein [Cynara cardunculus var. scolymus]